MVSVKKNGNDKAIAAVGARANEYIIKLTISTLFFDNLKIIKAWC